jgi:hypothetical protein
MIKQALTTDLRKLKSIAKAFFEECQLPGKFNFEHFERTWIALMVQEVGLVYIWEDPESKAVLGTVGGIVGPDLHTGDLVATESFWYVEKKHRARVGMALFHHFVEEAEKRNCARVSMAAVWSSPTFKSVHKFYTSRLNMRPLETHYYLDL